MARLSTAAPGSTSGWLSSAGPLQLIASTGVESVQRVCQRVILCARAHCQASLPRAALHSGLLSEDADGLRDIRDGRGQAVFRDMLVPMYTVAKKIVQRLGDKFKQPIDLPHV